MYDFKDYDLSGVNVDDLREKTEINLEYVKIPFFLRLKILFTGHFPMPKLDLKSIDLSNNISREIKNAIK